MEQPIPLPASSEILADISGSAPEESVTVTEKIEPFLDSTSSTESIVRATSKEANSSAATSVQLEPTLHTVVPTSTGAQLAIMVQSPASTASGGSTTAQAANILGQRTRLSSATVVPLSTGVVSIAKPPIVVKRGAARTVVTSASPTSATSNLTLTTTSVPVPKPQQIITVSRPGPTISSSSIPTTTGGGTFVKMIPVAMTSTTGTSSVLVPSGSGAASKPGAAVRAPFAKPVVKPVILGTTSVAAAAAAAQGAKKFNLPAKVLPMPNKALPVPTSITAKTNPTKVLSAMDKSMQQRKQLADTLSKLRKLEKHMVQSYPEQASPFTYGEIFQQTAVSFSKMASLTTHISLESMSSADQRRWTPELVNKFMGSVTTFATSLKEIGDELKKRHSDQLTKNLKRKAEEELANTKKAAAEAQKPIQSSTDSISIASVPLTNGTAIQTTSQPVFLAVVADSKPVVASRISEPEVPEKPTQLDVLHKDVTSPDVVLSNTNGNASEMEQRIEIDRLPVADSEVLDVVMESNTEINGNSEDDITEPEDEASEDSNSGNADGTESNEQAVVGDI